MLLIWSKGQRLTVLALPSRSLSLSVDYLATSTSFLRSSQVGHALIGSRDLFPLVSFAVTAFLLFAL